MDKLSLIKKYVVCPACFSAIIFENVNIQCSSCGVSYKLFDNDIISTVSDFTEEIEFSKGKWDEYYHDDCFQKEAEKIYKESTLPIVMKQIFECVTEYSETTRTFLEIGCGRAELGQEMARRGWLFIGIDYSLNILKSLKERLESQSIENYLLIHGDITSLPVRTGSIDFIYGGGVIEHFKDTQSVVNHLFRVLKKDGISFNSVPYFNIGNLVYRSLWGSIPNIPVLKQIAEFINIKALKGKHMRFGYELQFTIGQLKSIHMQAGFKPENISIDRFDYTVTLEFIKNQLLRNFFIYLIKSHRQFWQMVKVIGIKH